MGFGSSKSKSNQSSNSVSTSSSLNQAYPFIQEQLGGQVSNAGRGSNAIASLLGLSGEGDQSAAFETFKNSSGYNFIRDEGIKGIEGSMASRGLLNSGSALKAISGYSSNLASSFLNSYLANLMGLSNQGLQAGSIISGAGNTANSQSNSTSIGSSTAKSMNFTAG